MKANVICAHILHLLVLKRMVSSKVNSWGDAIVHRISLLKEL